MATIEQLSAALIKADAAGNAADAKVFADEIRRLRAAAAPPAQPSEVPMGRRAIQMVRPTVEALGSAGGAVLGTPLGPAGIVGGAGLGYGLAKGGLDIAEQALGYQKAPTSAKEALTRGAGDVLVGGAMEAGGRGIIAPTLQKAGEYASKVVNLKSDTYLKALEGKGQDILDLLRGQRAAVPGAAPGAGEVAAPAGSARFSLLQAKAQKVPSMVSEFAGAEELRACAFASRRRGRCASGRRRSQARSHEEGRHRAGVRRGVQGGRRRQDRHEQGHRRSRGHSGA
jgi:hypothetical protein